MRKLFASLALLAISSVPVIAHASPITLTFTMPGSAPITTTFDSSAGTFVSSGDGYEISSSALSGQLSTAGSEIVFYNPTAYLTNMSGFGSLDLFIMDEATGFSGFFTGPALYTGTLGASGLTGPIKASLTGDAALGTAGTAAIAINTPEPSSIVLLATGLAGLCFIAVRRRNLLAAPDSHGTCA